ncbi:hypothetical protein H2198_000809 [Neophaeococcomyces mojaviensis]|uniref:Uncharacterized protein n=1 Tax=Neophaeococcomyces mojaviensis TaxID=3383035 RepID=A0ACC3AJM1_9EURO|nr:hypothetical protein H2198_000809 [Knufia sp. JES_112]
MRLIDANTGFLKEFSPRKKPKYAVLSHRWTKDEVTFLDVQAKTFRDTSSLDKFWGSLRQARRDGLKSVWIDTCCIDKQSSAELSEAINSMYRWYQGAEYCYVYLHDVDKDTWQESFLKSKWFTRGWTLQELLAPPSVIFYDRQWQPLGDRKTLAGVISDVTGIELAALETGDLHRYSIAQKMSWAAKRVTSRPEDSAYCLMGLFGVNMPLLYGEGERAFLRLQEEIIKYNDDHSIFAWSMGRKKFSGLLAPAPACFVGSDKIVSSESSEGREPYSMTNRGLSIKLKIRPWSVDTYLAYLDCADKTVSKGGIKVGIFLRRLTKDDQYTRVKVSEKGLWLGGNGTYHMPRDLIRERQLFVRQTLDFDREKDCLKDREYGFKVSYGWLPSSARILAAHYLLDNCLALLPLGGWGCAMVIDISAQREGISKIALGFDFEFHPICLLEDSSSVAQHLDAKADNYSEWSSILSNAVEWHKITVGSHVYNSSNHDGIWRLRGHRLKSLNVLLPQSFMNKGSMVTLQRDKGRSELVWELKIDNLIGPFRNHYHNALEKPFGDRWGFQKACRLDMTDEDLERGDEILKTKFPSIGHIEPDRTPLQLTVT